MPASCSAIPSLAVSGVADGLDERPAGAAAMFVERSSLRGRCRELFGRVGDEGGSFLTMILGALPETQELEEVSEGIQYEKRRRASQSLTTWGNVVHLWEFSGHSVRL